MAMRDFSETAYIELPSDILAPQLGEVSKKVAEEGEEYMKLLTSGLSSVDDAVSLFVAIGMGLSLSAKQAILKDALEHAVECGNKSERLKLLSNNLSILPQHVVRLTIEQAKDFGL